MLAETGVLLQSLYLAATAMGLAACAVGLSDTDAFTELAGVEGHEHISVAEMALGSRPR
jgi:nitroreductase